MKLSEAGIGEKLVIRNLADNELRVRFLELGLTVDREISLIFKAPFGDPIALDLGDYQLALRKDEATHIDVERIA